MSINIRQLAARVEPGTLHPRGSPDQAQRAANRAPAFADELRRARAFEPAEGASLKVSAHAQQRLDQRDISLTEDQQRAISEAVQQLSGKGSREALLIRNDAAFIVNVPNRTIVTAVNQAELKERVFTNIDSAMLL